ncbi:interleukin-10 receptor subunit alpha [Pseudochaenichthys georgianus]|uniref:interleukin-10 receptor subunit alpha n=1 Tax=Pseudochaenichthys georgianus TaxID=52239 RepID=UPI00146DF2B8|nr:interleukin-10 receptor subunit alpha [Pseudochaenichthys georgianus]
MILSLQIPDMDIYNNTIFLFLILYLNLVSGLDLPQPDNVIVKISEGEVYVLWKHPVDAPSDPRYNVEMAKYTGGEWAMVASCTGIKKTHCDLSSLILEKRAGYKVRVQLVAGDNVSVWSQRKKFILNYGALQPPSFTLWATSSTLTVSVHQKPILKELFPFGLTYTIYLEERGQDTKNTTAYLEDNMAEDQRTTSFSSLHWGREYCVSIKVEGNGAAATSSSSVSPKQCLQLPEQEFFIMAVSSLSILGVLAIIAIIVTSLLCYLRGQEKTPAVLKSPVRGWLPLSVGEGAVEVVTDKGWFLSSFRTEVKTCVNDPMTHVTVTVDDEEEERRTSLDSGVSMETNSATNSEGSPPMRQEDSGFGSLGGSESSTSCQTDYPLQDEGSVSNTRKREDSGVGLCCQVDISSINLDGQDSGSLKVAGGNYRSQSPCAVQINICDEEEMCKQMLPDSVLAEVVTGYRAGPQSCICSGTGQCTWCHTQGHYGAKVIKQYRAVCIENGQVSNRCNFVDSYKGQLTFSRHHKQTQMDTVIVDDLETTFIQLGNTFPLLTTLSPLSLVEEGQDFNMNNLSLSLCDVQLTTE